VRVTGWAVVIDVQKGDPEYDMLADGAVAIVTVVVVENAAQLPDAAMV
jgi:hypothetical protein